MVLPLLLAAWVVLGGAPAGQPDPIGTLLSRVEQAAGTGDRTAILALGAAGTRLDALGEMAVALTDPTPERAVVRERDRTRLSPDVTRVLLEVFLERGNEASLSTWTIEVSSGADPRIVEVGRVSNVSGLYRLSLNRTRQLAVKDLEIRAPDFTLRLPSGSAFVAETSEGPTAVVLLGRGRMEFAPGDAAERTQVRIFAGRETLAADFDAAFIRVRPSEYDALFPAAALTPREVDPAALRRAGQVFDEFIGKSLQIDLTDLSRQRWSLTPNGSDLIAEVRTRKHGTLTYTRSRNDAEDIALFDRRRRRNIAVYASPEKLATRGRFYSEDDLVDYDVLAYDLDLALTPDRLWVEGTSRLKVRIRARQATTLSLRLNETLAVRSVSSPQFGRLLHLRVVGQNSLLVSLPATIVEGSEFWLSVTYAGRVPPQSLDREAIAIGAQEVRETYIPIEPHYIYSNRSYWYPQSTVTDYATASVRLSLPAGYDVIATGQPTGAPAPPPGVADPAARGRLVHVFEAQEPVRYLSCVVSRFTAVEQRTVTIPGVDGDGGVVQLDVRANPRQTGRARGHVDDASDIIAFYGSVVGGAPYPSFLTATVESDRPGGHSPAYFAVVNQVVLATDMVWRGDPVNFENYPQFFLAHEIAHQWWGHAVGWKNYHEQWISEGFAQYFAALYAEKARGPSLLASLIRQMRQTAVQASSQGPVHLGYRLGHIRGDDRVYRAIVYNKGAMVLHMLRRLLGDEAFFGGVRAFYREWKFRKAGTDDFRQVLERTTGRELTRFFEVWVYGSRIPTVKYASKVSGGEATLTFEASEPLDAALTVTVAYASGAREDVRVTLAGRSTSVRIPVSGPVRSFTVNGDHAALVNVQR